MKVIDAMKEPITQAEFAQLNDISEARVSQLVGEGIIPAGVTGLEMQHAYVGRIREQAAGRVGNEVGGLDLAQERAALAREQRIGQAIKNAVARREYAPVEILADVLAAAASATVDRFEQLDGMLQKACPDLPDEAKIVVQQVIANARNEWIRATDRKVLDQVDSMVRPDGDIGGLEEGLEEELPQ